VVGKQKRRWSKLNKKASDGNRSSRSTLRQPCTTAGSRRAREDVLVEIQGVQVGVGKTTPASRPPLSQQDESQNGKGKQGEKRMKSTGGQCARIVIIKQQKTIAREGGVE